jgi:hypothetical protein
MLGDITLEDRRKHFNHRLDDNGQLGAGQVTDNAKNENLIGSKKLSYADRTVSP